MGESRVVTGLDAWTGVEGEGRVEGYDRGNCEFLYEKEKRRTLVMEDEGKGQSFDGNSMMKNRGIRCWEEKIREATVE